MKLKLKIITIFFSLISLNVLAEKSCCNTDIVTDDCTTLLENSDCGVYGKTTYVPRPQGDNLARRMIGVQDKIHIVGDKNLFALTSVSLEYQRAFNNQSCIGQWFSSTGNSTMSYGVISGINDNENFDINSLNFGITGSGTITLCPSKYDIIIDVSSYLGLDEFLCGLWARLDIPMAYSKWNLGISETVNSTGSTTLPLGLFNSNANSSLFRDKDNPMTLALQGGIESKFGQVKAIERGKIGGAKSDFDVSGIRLDIGYDWIRKNRFHFTTALDFVFPLGTTPNTEFLFQPMVGDYKRSQVGIFANLGIEIWSNYDATKSLSFYSDFIATALVGKRMERVLGLKNNNTPEQETWNQYLTLKKFTYAGDSFTYANSLERAVNITSGRIKVKTAGIIDFAALLQYNKNKTFYGVGYEFWYRSKEELSQLCFTIKNNRYAIQGVQNITDNKLLVDPNAGINIVNYNQDGTNNDGQSAPTVSTNNTLSTESLDYSRALAPSMYSNKIFMFIGYNIDEIKKVEPYVTLGAEVEFAQQNRTFDQWGVLLKTGIKF